MNVLLVLDAIKGGIYQNIDCNHSTIVSYQDQLAKKRNPLQELQPSDKLHYEEQIKKYEHFNEALRSTLDLVNEVATKLN